MTKLVRTTAMLALLVAGSAPAFAAPAMPSQEVRYADLDLASAAGQAALDQRVRRAATHVCGGQSRELREQGLINSCRDIAIAAVASQRELAVANARRGAQVAATGTALRVAAR